MHHPVSGINSLIHFVNLASHVSTHLLIHLSAHLYYHHIITTLIVRHSFTPGSKPICSTNLSQINTFPTHGLLSRSWDWTGLIILVYLFLFFFNFSVCSVW